MNYIFLDVDGVLNNEIYFHEHLDDDGILDEENIKLLADLVNKTNANVVLSSSWRTLFTEKGNPRRPIFEKGSRRGFELKRLLKKYGIKIIGRTEVAKNKILFFFSYFLNIISVYLSIKSANNLISSFFISLANLVFLCLK